MGRDIYPFIERRSKFSDRWECVDTDSSLMDKVHLYRWPKLFALLSYNAYEGKEGIAQKPLKDWAMSLSPEVNEYLFFLLTPSLNCKECLFSANELDDRLIINDLNTADPVSPQEAIRWLDDGVSFLLSENIVSNPDACFWNWCTANELEWAVMKACEGNKPQHLPYEDYLRLVSIMRGYETGGYEVRMVYTYDFSTRWLK